MSKIIVNGTFDILHRGHLEMLNYAKSLGEHLLVCIDTDSRVRELKGPSRPINNQDDRKFMLEQLSAVDAVWFFSSKEQLIKIIEIYKPDIMVKGSDYRGKSVIGETYVPQVVYFDRIDKYSSTDIIARCSSMDRTNLS